MASCTSLFVLNIVWSTRALWDYEWINLLLILFLVSFHLPSSLCEWSDCSKQRLLFPFVHCFSPLLPAGVFSSVYLSISGADGKFRDLLKSVAHSCRLFLLRSHIPIFLLNLPHFSCLIFVLITRAISRFILHTENRFPFHPLQRKQTHFSQISQISASLCKSHNAPQSLCCSFNPNRKVYMKTSCLFHWLFFKSLLMLFNTLSPNPHLNLHFFFTCWIKHWNKSVVETIFIQK